MEIYCVLHKALNWYVGRSHNVVFESALAKRLSAALRLLAANWMFCKTIHCFKNTAAHFCSTCCIVFSFSFLLKNDGSSKKFPHGDNVSLLILVVVNLLELVLVVKLEHQHHSACSAQEDGGKREML